MGAPAIAPIQPPLQSAKRQMPSAAANSSHPKRVGETIRQQQSHLHDRLITPRIPLADHPNVRAGDLYP